MLKIGIVPVLLLSLVGLWVGLLVGCSVGWLVGGLVGWWVKLFQGGIKETQSRAGVWALLLIYFDVHQFI